MTEELFIEIGTEEIPARFLDTAQAALGEGTVKLLGNVAHGAVRTFATPRRLAVSVQNVSATRPSAEKLITGPAAAIAFKDGQLTPAGEAFARKNGVPTGAVF
ncbi:MAG TPA: glycine--tRNA ligase subunit beta, partial [Myxococcota bacterium]|nr:glycine--tRNA ligase subunit beta [Myxococcota bacterium]